MEGEGSGEGAVGSCVGSGEEGCDSFKECSEECVS